MSAPPRVVLSCEHAGNDVPAEYAGLFDSTEGRAALRSHRGWDPGSLPLGEAMAEVLGAPIAVQRMSRLLVECNRSLDHPRLFSEFSRVLPAPERESLIEAFWRPHRNLVRDLLRQGMSSAGRGDDVAAGPSQTVVHVGVHTFTPVWKGRERATDIGFLFDPARAAEAHLVRGWRKAFVDRFGATAGTGGERVPMSLHLNRPYRGWTDGLTTALRQECPEAGYVGIELEVSQRHAHRAEELGERLAEALQAALALGLTKGRERQAAPVAGHE